MGVVHIGVRVPDLAEDTLRFYRQAGAEVVEMPARFTDEATHRSPAPLLPSGTTARPTRPVAAWELAELHRIRNRLEEFELMPVQMNLPLPRSILLGREGYAADTETVAANVAAAGRAGIPTLRYTFRAMRPQPGYYLRPASGRGGADLRAFDFDRIRNDPPVESTGRHSKEEMWERLERFLRAIVPVAEAAGVRLAHHPNDPPSAEYRGVAQPVATVTDMERLVDTVDSPSNTIVAHPGVFTEMGEDAVVVLRSFGERQRIGAVHFRNVRCEVPFERYVETFIDEGDADMAACMRVLHETGFGGMVDPDHVPGIAGDTEDQRMSWAYALGAIAALRNSTLPSARPGGLAE
jgi:mannonate dehydratase